MDVSGLSSYSGIMKLISLNLWAGRAGEEKVAAFIEKHRDVDIFCFQEMLHGGQHLKGTTVNGTNFDTIVPELFERTRVILKDHVSYFYPHVFDYYGLTMFVKKNHVVSREGEVFIYKERGYLSKEEMGDHARNLQYATFEAPEKITVINVHGLWNGKGKGDSADRLLQSDNIVSFLKTIPGPYVMCGDFNLLPETESLKKIEAFGLRNLISEFGITSTRSDFYPKPERFADYVFVSPEIKVNEFRVLDDQVSDHLALYLDFQL